MLLPNKLFSYNESVLSKLIPILRLLDSPKSPSTLLQSLGNRISNPIELIDVLDCLYALKKIQINNEGKIEKC